MTPELITAIGAAVAVLFGAVVLLLKQVGALARTLRQVDAKADEIHTSTNGAAEASSLELKALRQEVESLRNRLDESHQAASDVRAAMKTGRSRYPGEENS